MDLSELLFGHLSGSTTHKILCVTIHWERNDLTNILLIAKKHDHAVNTRCHSCMWRCTELESIIQCAKLLLEILFRITCDLERFYHDLHIVITHCTGR